MRVSMNTPGAWSHQHWSCVEDRLHFVGKQHCACIDDILIMNRPCQNYPMILHCKKHHFYMHMVFDARNRVVLARAVPTYRIYPA